MMFPSALSDEYQVPHTETRRRGDRRSPVRRCAKRSQYCTVPRLRERAFVYKGRHGDGPRNVQIGSPYYAGIFPGPPNSDGDARGGIPHSLFLLRQAVREP
jgi:hypothetical protein